MYNETYENNKLIAEFMALDKGKYEILLPHWGWFDERKEKNFSKFKYNTSWDWLMPVVEKISDLQGYTTSATIEFLAEFYYKDADNADGLIGKEEFYKAVVEFIKEYNYNLKKLK